MASINVLPLATHHAAITRLRDHLNDRIIGQPGLIMRLLIALLSDGHLLVEGAPGLAKTTAIKELATMIEGDFHRIQFTPDLLPADLTGNEIYHPQNGSFTFQPGPQQIELRPRARTIGVLALLKALADKFQPFAPASPQALTRVLSRLCQITRPGSLIFLLSDFATLNQQVEIYLNQICQHSEIVAGFIYDPLEKDPPPPNHYAITDGEQVLNIDTTVVDVCQQYRQQFLDKQNYLYSILRRCHIPLLKFATDEVVEYSLAQQWNQQVADDSKFLVTHEQ